MSNFVQYNGVQLGFVRTRAFAQEPVQIGPDYAAQRYLATWEVTGSRLTVGQVGGVGPGGVPGVAPVDTSGTRALVQLHDALMAPRRALRVRVGGIDLVNVTSAGDVELGPKPLKFVVTSFQGEQGFTAEYTVQYTLPNPCPGRNGVMAFLAHVWKAEDDLDRHFFMTRTYTGVLHLDPRAVGAQGQIHPDAIRRLYLPSRTPGTHRECVQVRTLEDGYTVAYKVQDRQPTAIVNSKDVVRMEGTHRVTHQTPGRASRSRREAAMWDFANLKDWIINPVQKFPTLDVARHDPSTIPTVTHAIQATAFGHPSSPYSTLTRAARVVVLFRLMNSGAFRHNGWLDFDGEFTQEDKSDPKSSTCALLYTTRPNQMFDAPKVNRGRMDAAEDLWNPGRNLMPTIRNNTIAPEAILGPDNQRVPDSIQNLVFGGSVLNATPDLWGWLASVFAPDMMSDRDAAALGPQGFADFARVDATTSRGVNARFGPAVPLEAQLLAAVQNLCGYKARAAFATTANRGALP